MLDDYMRLGWHQHDERYLGVPVMEKRGIITDLDCVDADRMRASAYYQDFLGTRGYAWFAGVGFRAGGDLWCVSIQRKVAQGPFQRSDLRALKALWRPFSEAATLSRQFEQVRIEGISEGVEALGHAALVCDKLGQVVKLNAKAEVLIGSMLDPSRKTLRFRDGRSAEAFEDLLAAALRAHLVSDASPLVTTVLDRSERRLLVRALSLKGIGPFLAPNGLVLVLMTRCIPAPDDLLAEKFALTSSELQIAKALAAGLLVPEIAAERFVKPETIRAQLKAIYAKTDTHTQAQLVAMLAKCPSRNMLSR